MIRPGQVYGGERHIARNAQRLARAVEPALAVLPPDEVLLRWRGKAISFQHHSGGAEGIFLFIRYRTAACARVVCDGIDGAVAPLRHQRNVLYDGGGKIIGLSFQRPAQEDPGDIPRGIGRLGGLLADAFGWRSVYFAAAAMMIICFAMMFKILPDQQAIVSKRKYADILKSLWTLLKKYPYLRFASLRASLAYGSFFALWSTLSFKMKQPPFFAGDDIIGALGLCGLAGAATVVFISSYIYKYGAKIFSAIGAFGIILAWLAALIGPDNYAWIIFAILVLDAGMQCIHLSNQTSVVALDSAAINRINTVYMSVYFVGGALGTFVGGLCWQHWGWTGVAASGIIFAAASLIVNALAPLEKRKA